jgi:hypothetical protein
MHPAREPFPIDAARNTNPESTAIILFFSSGIPQVLSGLPGFSDKNIHPMAPQLLSG